MKLLSETEESDAADSKSFCCRLSRLEEFYEHILNTHTTIDNVFRIIQENPMKNCPARRVKNRSAMLMPMNSFTAT